MIGYGGNANGPRKIKEYLFIDRCAEGIGYTVPKPGETITITPWGWEAEDSPPVIYHTNERGTVTRTVNPMDVAVIEFEIGEGE